VGVVVVLVLVVVFVAFWRKRRRVLPSKRVDVPVGFVRPAREAGRGLKGERL
jgi:hypothetical protein